MLLLAAVSALGASILTAGLIAAVGVLDLTSTTMTPAVERQLIRPQPTALGAAVPPVVAIADRIRPAVAQLQVRLSDHIATGSAVIFRSDGHLLTNLHVVQGALDVQVVLSTGHKVAGRVVGSDRDTDTAVVKIDGGPFPVATLGTASDLKVGQTAIAVGSPAGLSTGPTVTVGVVSALHRQIKSPGDGPTLVDMVQTDAPIAPGSTGGALLDDDGAVIGIMAVAGSSDNTADGLGFATPVDMARSVADELINTGRVVHVWIGVEGSDLDGTTAGELNLDGGAMVAQVTGGSPAQQAGIVARDVIVAVNGKAVRSMGELVVALRGSAPGEAVTLDVMRDRQRRTVSVLLAARPG
jgi:S1-C subfamily serine protease